MKVAGIITEYNPFHKGHAYHIEQARELSGADYVIAVMSGDYVQRGLPAFLDKYTRTEMALLCGVDLVLELPCAYAVGSAEYFAMGAVSLLDKLGVIDTLCFGSECGDIKALQEISSQLSCETPIFQEKLKCFLKEGHSYPTARSLAIEVCRLIPGALDGMSLISFEEIQALLSEPNNTLGMEYLKSIKRRNSPIIPITIKRSGSGYHEHTFSEDFASATAIRSSILNGDLDAISPYVPESVYQILKREYRISYPIAEDDFSLLLYYQLLTSLQSDVSLAIYQDISKDLGLRIGNELSLCTTFSEFASHIKTKQYTLTRINRSLLHILLGLKKQDYQFYAMHDFVPYARILGFRNDSQPLLKYMKAHTQIPLINKVSNAFYSLESAGKKMLYHDIFAADLYRKIQEDKFKISLKNEYTRGLIIH